MLSTSVEAEYRAIAHAACELMWIQYLSSEMGVIYNKSMMMYCDNQAAMYVANNLSFFMSERSILKSTAI